jgi:hypothetical protein
MCSIKHFKGTREMNVSSMIPAMRNAQATHVDFGFLRGIISSNPNFMPSNIDMVLERKGNFLFGEWKREDEEMKTGQKIHRVILITGYVDTQPHITLIQEVLPTTGNLKVVGKSHADLIKYIQDWYKNVEEDDDDFALYR